MTAGDIKIRTGNHKDCMSGAVINGTDDWLHSAALGAAEGGATVNTKGTISAWINVPDITNSGYSVFCLGDTNANEILWLGVEGGTLIAQCIDAGTTKWDINSTASVIIPNHWQHICLVQDGIRPRMYVDGVAVAMTDTTAVDLTYWTKELDGLDVATIGVNKFNNVTTQDFKGCISNVKYSSGTTSAAAWTAAQVLAEYNYRGGTNGYSAGTASNLATYTLDNSLVDTQTGGGTYTLTVESDVQFDVEYSNLTSIIRTLAPVVADDVCIIPNGDGTAIVMAVKAA